MSWNLGLFSLKILPRYKIPFTIGSASFKWLHIIVRLGYQVKIWLKSCRKSPKDLCKRLRITLKSANQKNWRLPSKKHLFCAFLTNCLVLDYHLYCLIFPWPFCLAKTYINDKNTFFWCFLQNYYQSQPQNSTEVSLISTLLQLSTRSPDNTPRTEDITHDYLKTVQDYTYKKTSLSQL